MNIHIENLRIRTCHGVYDFEKVTPQEFIVHSEITLFDVQSGQSSDNIQDTISYEKIREVLIEVLGGPVSNTLEYLTDEANKKILRLGSTIHSVTTTIEKTEIFEDCIAGVTRTSHSPLLYKYTLSLGSNLGDREKYLSDAIDSILRLGLILRRSSIHETTPVPKSEQGDFLNMVLILQSSHEPFALLKEIEEIMQKAGRVRSIKNGARTLDIDILTCNDLIIETERLVLPHPRMYEREFVLRPLYETI